MNQVALSTSPISRPSTPGLRTVLVASTNVFLSVAIFCLWRSVSGSFRLALSPAALLLLGLALLTIQWVASAIWDSAMGRTSARFRYVYRCAMMLACGALAAAVTVPHAFNGWLAMLWCFVAFGGAVTWLPRRPDSRWNSPRSENEYPCDRAAEVTNQANCTAPPSSLLDDNPNGASELEDEESLELLPPGVSQKLTRARDESGAEVFFGLLRHEFEPGQRQQNLHVAFCPPLPRVPELAVDQLDGPEVRIKTQQVETFGMCLEAKLPGPHREPVAVQIQVYAYVPADSAPHS